MLLGPTLVAALAAVGAVAHGPRRSRHGHSDAVQRSIDREAERELVDLESRSSNTTSHLEKRAFHGWGTYFHVGLGACGGWNNDGDLMVALNEAQFDFGVSYPGPHCGKTMTISARGTTVSGIPVTDMCPYPPTASCQHGDLDMSPALFSRFAALGVGRMEIQWWWDNGAPEPQPQPTPEPTPEWKPEPTPEWKPEPTPEHTPEPAPSPSPSPSPEPSTSTQATSETSSSAASSSTSSTSAESSATLSASSSALSSSVSSAGNSSLSASTTGSLSSSGSHALPVAASARPTGPIETNTSIDTAGAGNLENLPRLLVQFGYLIVRGAQ